MPVRPKIQMINRFNNVAVRCSMERMESEARGDITPEASEMSLYMDGRGMDSARQKKGCSARAMRFVVSQQAALEAERRLDERQVTLGIETNVAF